MYASRLQGAHPLHEGGCNKRVTTPSPDPIQNPVQRSSPLRPAQVPTSIGIRRCGSTGRAYRVYTMSCDATAGIHVE